MENRKINPKKSFLKDVFYTNPLYNFGIFVFVVCLIPIWFSLSPHVIKYSLNTILVIGIWSFFFSALIIYLLFRSVNIYKIKQIRILVLLFIFFFLIIVGLIIEKNRVIIV